MIILGIETSCDDTAAAVLCDGSELVSNVVSSQHNIHSQYGGIIPEVAARQHFKAINSVLKKAVEPLENKFRDVDAIAVTNGPGLAGSLLVGVNVAKGLALSIGVPVIGVNHLEGHVYSTWIEHNEIDKNPGFPLLCLIASGAHTDLVLMKDFGSFSLIGRTRDDASGEAFDKGARMLGLGFPGGPEIQKAAINGDAKKRKFTKSKMPGTFDFSFSGIKSDLRREIEIESSKGKISSQKISDFAAGYEEGIVDYLVSKTVEAVKEHYANGIIIGGGVASNQLLREEIADKSPVPVFIPRPNLCTDNGAMIAMTGWIKFKEKPSPQWDLDVIPGMKIG